MRSRGGDTIALREVALAANAQRTGLGSASVARPRSDTPWAFVGHGAHGTSRGAARSPRDGDRARDRRAWRSVGARSRRGSLGPRVPDRARKGRRARDRRCLAGVHRVAMTQARSGTSSERARKNSVCNQPRRLGQISGGDGLGLRGSAAVVASLAGMSSDASPGRSGGRSPRRGATRGSAPCPRPGSSAAAGARARGR
jgi:hypothetical protein